MIDLINQQFLSTSLVLQYVDVKFIFVDGAISKNVIFMNLLTTALTALEVFAAMLMQAKAMNTAFTIHGN